MNSISQPLQLLLFPTNLKHNTIILDAILKYHLTNKFATHLLKSCIKKYNINQMFINHQATKINNS